MAIARGAGTEIIRSTLYEDIGAVATNLIVGVQHHIYTVLSVTVHAVAVNTSDNYVKMHIQGFDTGPNYATAQVIKIFQQTMNANETFVWNDKFSFNGFEGVALSSTLSTTAEQDAIADQGSSVVQYLIINGGNANNQFDGNCTYIDQNNA
jgi:hypothetical protein